MSATSAAVAELARTALREFPHQAAALIERSDDAETAGLLAAEHPDVCVGVLHRLTPDRASRVLAAMPQDALSALMPALEPHRAAGWLARLDESEREHCLSAVSGSLETELRELAAYPANTAGALMDPRVTTFLPDAFARDVTKRLRRFRARREQEVFLVDATGRLVGALSLRDVVLAAPGSRLDGLVQGPPATVQATSSRDEAIDTFTKQRLSSLPVVDFEGRLLGVLRQRELIGAAQEQATAAAVTMVGASTQERALSSPWFAVRKRLPWLEVNLLTAFLAASVVGLFEDTIARVTALAVLLPVVAGQSGNTGAQALAVTMRGLTLREVRTRDWFRVAGKELLAGAGNGVAVALTTAAAVFVWSQSAGLSMVIGISMVISMTLAGASGAVIPMLLTAIRQDPAQSSSIILTTVTDVVGFFSFLGIATLLSGML